MTLIQFDKKCKCGAEFVCVKILDNCDTLKVGNIWLPDKSYDNQILAHALVEDIGSIAEEKLGLKVGEYVLIDRLATFAHTSPIALLKYDSIIMKANKENNDYEPLRNCVFVEPDQKDDFTDVGGVFVQNYAERLNTGTITKMNLDKENVGPFKVGSKVLLVKGGDFVQVGEKNIYIYKHDMLICTIEE